MFVICPLCSMKGSPEKSVMTNCILSIPVFLPQTKKLKWLSGVPSRHGIPSFDTIQWKWVWTAYCGVNSWFRICANGCERRWSGKGVSEWRARASHLQKLKRGHCEACHNTSIHLRPRQPTAVLSFFSAWKGLRPPQIRLKWQATATVKCDEKLL